MITMISYSLYTRYSLALETVDPSRLVFDKLSSPRREFLHHPRDEVSYLVVNFFVRHSHNNFMFSFHNLHHDWFPVVAGYVDFGLGPFTLFEISLGMYPVDDSQVVCSDPSQSSLNLVTA